MFYSQLKLHQIMKLSNDFRCYGIGFCLHCFMVIVSTHQNCSPPDVPADGKYIPKRSEFLPEDKVSYSCDEGFILTGGHTRICESNGTWSGKTPFCDRQIKNLRGDISLSHDSMHSIIDGDSKTCLSWPICTGCHLELPLYEQVAVRTIKINLTATGAAPIRIEIFLDDDWKQCTTDERDIKAYQWIVMQCPINSGIHNKITIVNKADTDMYICEIRVFGKNRISHEDREIKLKNLLGKITLSHHSISHISDGNNNTCPSWGICAGCHLQLYLEEQAVIQAIRIFFKATGSSRTEIVAGLNTDWKKCDDENITTSQWILMRCQSNNSPSNIINIKNTADADTTICEIQVFGRNENDCEHPPVMRISNGYFQVSRNNSTLICEDGYKRENGSLVCSENSWEGHVASCDEIVCDHAVFNSTLTPNGHWLFLDAGKKLSAETRRQLKCNNGYEITGGPVEVVCLENGTWAETNATCIEAKPLMTIILGAVGAVLAIIILILVGIIICLLRKQRKNEAVYKLTYGSVTLGSESEYSIPYYESVQPDIPSTPRPAALPPDLNDGYTLPDDYKETTMRKPDIAFGTLKESIVYGK